METQIYDIASNAGRVLLNPFLLTVPVVGALVLVTGFAGRVADTIGDLRYMSVRRWHAPAPRMARQAPSLRRRADGEMTGQERIEPDGNRQDDTARRLHLVPEDRQLINVSGCNVDPTAVEEVLNRHSKVAKAAAIGVPDTGTGEAVKAFIVLTEGGSAEQILTWMRDPATGMATYLVPKYIEFRRSLPLD